MDSTIIETFNLSKIYRLKRKGKKILALNDVNIAIKEGEKFGLLGPNGAGKTTLVSILSTLIQPTKGYAIIDGYNILKKPNHVKNKIGLMLGRDMIYHRLTGYANLKFFCKIYEISDYKEKINNIAKELNLKNWLNVYVEKYSTGMRVKLSLCRILLLDRKILFLDEPTLGLDIKTTNFIVEKMKKIGKTIFLTSHNMNVVEKLCDRVAFINNGNILKVGNKTDFKNFMEKGIKIDIEIYQKKDKLKLELDQQDFIIKTKVIESGLIIYLKERKHYKDLFSILNKYLVYKLREEEMSLEQLFLKII